MLQRKIIKLIEDSIEKQKYSLAQLISILESSLQEHQLLKRKIISHPLFNGKPKGLVLGLAGPPGVGKSSLVNALVQSITKSNQNTSVAIVAIDPTSIYSKGSILGDRTRTKFAVGNKNIYFRSQPTDLDLGGLGKNTFNVIRLLEKIFDLVIVETVGVGQSEVEIKYLADYTMLVVQPFSGDQIQFIKSGIMEIPDLFVVNKCDDEKKANLSYNQLVTSLEFLKTSKQQQIQNIFLTSCVTQKGIEKLVSFITELLCNYKFTNDTARFIYFFRKSVFHSYGEYGIAFMQQKSYLAKLNPQNYDDILEQFYMDIRKYVQLI